MTVPRRSPPALTSHALLDVNSAVSSSEEETWVKISGVEDASTCSGVLEEVAADVAMMQKSRPPPGTPSTARTVDAAKALLPAGGKAWPAPIHANGSCRVTPPVADMMHMHTQRWHARLADRATAAISLEARCSLPPDLLFDVLSDPSRHADIFDDIVSSDAELLSAHGSHKRWRLDVTARWRFWKLAGTCHNKMVMTTDADAGTVSFQLAEPGFLRRYEGEWSIRAACGTPIGAVRSARSRRLVTSSAAARSAAAGDLKVSHPSPPPHHHHHHHHDRHHHHHHASGESISRTHTAPSSTAPPPTCSDLNALHQRDCRASAAPARLASAVSAIARMQQDALQGLVASAGGAANTLAKNLTADEAKPLAKDEWQATTMLASLVVAPAAARIVLPPNTLGGQAACLQLHPGLGGGGEVTPGGITGGVGRCNACGPAGEADEACTGGSCSRRVAGKSVSACGRGMCTAAVTPPARQASQVLPQLPFDSIVIAETLTTPAITPPYPLNQALKAHSKGQVSGMLQGLIRAAAAAEVAAAAAMADGSGR